MMTISAKTVLLCGCAALWLTTPAAAQDSPAAGGDADASGSGDIIVTARRTEERLQDVPISISVFSQEQLAQRNITAGVDLATYTPSLSVTNQFGPERASFAIRGFVQEPNSAPSVGVFFADVVTPRGPQGNIQIGGGAGPGRFFDLQNVQVLKGPQGTLFGRNTTGGSVLLVPNRPGSTLGGFIEGSLGNYDMRRLQAAVDIPLADTFRVRLGFDRQVRDGWMKNKSGIGPKRFNDVDYWAARISVVAELTPNLENYTIANLIDSDTTGAIQKVIACAPNVFLGSFACGKFAAAQAAGDGFYDVRQPLADPFSHSLEWQLINTTSWQASDTLKIKNIASYGQQRLDVQTPLSDTLFQSPALPGLPSYVFPFVNVLRIPGTHAAEQETVTEELQLQGNSANNRLNWQAGFYFEKSRSLSPASQLAEVIISCTNSLAKQCTDIVGTLFGVPIGSLQTTAFSADYRSIGLYGQASYALTDQLTLTGGVRYTWDRSSVDQVNSVVPFIFDTPLPPICSQVDADANCLSRFRQKSQKPTWVLDLEYKPNDELLLYGKYSRGYRTGAITAVLPQQFAVSSPEKVDSFEVGVKKSFQGAVRGYFNVAAFYNKFSNQQLALSLVDNPDVPGVVPGSGGIINVGRSRIYGAEVEAEVSPVEGLSFNLSYAYLNARIQAITLPDLGNSPYRIESVIGPGDSLLQSPKHKLSATVRYTLPLDDSIGRIALGATFAYAARNRTNYLDRGALVPGFGPVFGTDLQPITSDLGIVPSYSLLNLNLDWSNVGGSNFDLALFATNVTKERFLAFTAGLLTSTGYEAASLNEPRMFGARVRYRF